MAKKSSSPSSKKPGSSKRRPMDDSIMGMPLRTWISGVVRESSSKASGKRGGVAIAFGHCRHQDVKAKLADRLKEWQLDLLERSEAEFHQFHGRSGPIWVLRAPQVSTHHASQHGDDPLKKSGYARFRDLAGTVVPQLAAFSLGQLAVELYDLTLEEERGFMVGLEMAAYSFVENRNRKVRRQLPPLVLLESSPALNESEIEQCSALALSTNLARHLTNLPGGELNPGTYAAAVELLFKASSTVTVEVWEGRKLVSERMNLLRAVGEGAAVEPRLVHLRYRPKHLRGKKGSSSATRPVALVGKGITFDSGGLDIKTASGMRLMKKDMGGSAAVVGILKWAELVHLELPLDAYLSLAENAVSGRSFRPGDVLSSRAGITVEIHNTDAEGRLALADALDVAVTQSGPNKPTAVIDIATLTGAIKVGLGTEIAGLFSNSDDLSRELSESGRLRGDLLWRMPLYQPYRSVLRSTFADFANCSDGFGGAIAAALFLEAFVQGTPWAHLDIYSWRDNAGGAWSESGGSGQAVQAVCETLARLASGRQAGRRA